MWMMILIAVHISNPSDIPGKINLEFKTEQQCKEALQSMTFWLKFDNFKVEGTCKEKI
jgi:hypothetical protein